MLTILLARKLQLIPEPLTPASEQVAMSDNDETFEKTLEKCLKKYVTNMMQGIIRHNPLSDRVLNSVD